MRKIALFILVFLLIPMVLAEVTSRLEIHYKTGDYEITGYVIDASSGAELEYFNGTIDDYGNFQYTFISSERNVNVSITLRQSGKLVKIDGEYVTKLGPYSTGGVISINLNPTTKTTPTPEPEPEPEPTPAETTDNTNTTDTSDTSETSDSTETTETEEVSGINGSAITDNVSGNSNLIYIIVFGIISLLMLGAIIFLYINNQKLKKKDTGFYHPPGESPKKPEEEKSDPVKSKLTLKLKGSDDAALEEAERKIKEAQQEIESIRNKKRRLEEAERKFESAQKELEQAKKEAGE